MAEVSQANRCWVCDSTDCDVHRESGLDRALESRDLIITDSQYGRTVKLMRCRRCGFVFGDRDEVRGVTKLYARLEDRDYEDGAEVRSLQMAKLVEAALAVCPSAKTLLDIGAGVGYLVKEASSRGLEAEGVEPSAWAASRARDRSDLKVHTGIFPHADTDGRLFDIITLVDVIEHVERPLELLASVRRQLSPKGVCVVVTPDVSSLAARLLGHRWWHYRLAHIGFFDDRTIRRTFARASLRVVKRSRATWFFTVGYLMERSAVYFGGLKRLNRKLRGSGLYQMTVPLNLFDSWCYMVRADEQR